MLGKIQFDLDVEPIGLRSYLYLLPFDAPSNLLYINPHYVKSTKKTNTSAHTH